MKMVGHKTQAIYERYAIADVAALEEAAVKLAALHDRDTAKAVNVMPLNAATKN